MYYIYLLNNMNIILKFIGLACFWFSLGVFLYFKLENANLGINFKQIFKKIQQLNFFELFLIFFMIYFLFSFFLQFLLFNISLELANLSLDPNGSFATQPSEPSTVSNSSTFDS